MSRQISELEQILRQLTDEHRKLLAHAQRQQDAMRGLDLKAMDDTARLQEAGRMRIAALETKRRNLIVTIARSHRMTQVPTLPDLAAMYPAQSAMLLKARDELKATMKALQQRTHVVSRLA